METIPEEVNEGRRRLQGMKKKKKSGQLFYSTHHQHIARPLQTAEVKLAAVAVSLNIRLRSANMPVPMQERAFRYTRTLVTSSSTSRSPNPSHIALALKKEFDASYGPAWHCIVGKSFGSFVTHSPGGFLYFSLDNNLSILLFKTEVRPLVGN